MWSPGIRFATEVVKLLGAFFFDESGPACLRILPLVDALGLFPFADDACGSRGCADADFHVIDGASCGNGKT